MSDIDASVQLTGGVQGGFTPSNHWQEIPDGTAVPPGGEYRMEADSGRNYGRWPEAQVSSPYAHSQPWEGGKGGWSAPANAADAFDYASYEQARQTGQYVNKPASAFAGVAAPLPPPPPPPEDPWRNINNGRANGQFVSRVDDPSAPWNAPPPVMTQEAVSPSSRYTSYDEAAQAKADILSDARNSYTASGRFSAIGKAGFNSEVEEAWVSAGLAEPSDPKANRHSNSSHNLTYALGGGLLELGSAGGRLYAEENSGKYLTPEQQNTAAAGLLPGIGAIGGALAGLAVGNPMMGAMVGGGVASLAEGVMSAGNEREQATRETAERLAASLGLAAESVEKFKGIIEQTGTPVAQLSQAIATVGGVGTFGPNTTQGVGALTNAFGEFAGENWAAIAKYSSGPLRHGLGNMVSTGDLGADGIESMGFDAAEQGDFAGLKTLQEAAQKAKLKGDATYQAAKKKYDEQTPWAKDTDNWLNKADLWFQDNVPAVLGGGTVDDVTKARDARRIMDTREKLDSAGDDSAKVQNDLINQFAQIKSDMIVAQSGISVAASGISLTEARGGSATQIGAASEVLYGKLGEARTATQSEISQLQADLADPMRSLGRKPELTAEIAQAQAQLATYDVTQAQQQRRVFDAQVDENTSAYNLTTAGDQGTLTHGIYAGKSYNQLKGSEISLLGDESAHANDLRAFANNPILSPADRDRYRAAATTLDNQQAVQQYQFAQGQYNEENLNLDITRSQRQGRVEYEQYFGTPMDVYNASINNIQTDRDQINQNNSEIKRGNLTFEQKQRLVKQNTDLGNDIEVAPERARSAYYGSEGALLAGNQTGDRAGLSRDVGLYGNSAFGMHNVLGDDQARIDNDYRDYTTSPNGSVAQKQAYGRWKTDSADRVQDEDSGYLYRQTQGERVKYMRDAGELHRAEIAPWMDGSPEANPFTRRVAVLQDLQAQLSGAQKALTATPQNSPAYEANAAKVDEFQSRIAEVEHERMFDITRLLPEMIAGAGGRGTLSGVLPTSGQAAFFNGNPYVTGTFGPHAREAGAANLGDHSAMPGGVTGRMLAATAGGNGSGGDPHLAALNRIASILEGLKNGGSTRTAPNMGGASGGFNAIKPRNTDGEKATLY